MGAQATFEFPTSSPINIEKLGGQNKRLYDWLIAGNKINCMGPERKSLKIGYLNSRVSDLIHKHRVAIKSEYVEVEYEGEKTIVKQYWIDNL